MSDLVQLEMTLDEARETDRLIKRHINTTRYLLLDMRDRKGWKALGYESFVEYGDKELGFASTHLYRLAESAEISLQIGYSPIGENVQPPESQLRPLTQVPESVRKEIWDEAIQHATNCGLMLLQVKASLPHGEWLPWLKQQQESGAIGFSQQTASKYMKLASNYNHERNLSEAPSIRAALELL